MEIGIDDDLDYVEDTPQLQIEDELIEDSQSINYQEENESSSDDFIELLLKSRGIENSSKIKFEDENGIIEEVDWNNLSNDDKLALLESSNEDPDVDLDDEEIELINALRQSQLNPKEYILAIQKDAVDRYIQHLQNQSQPVYKIDGMSDDELFVLDLMVRTNDITQEESYELLSNAKTNEILFKKLIDSLRNEYKKKEDEIVKQQQLEQQLIQQQQYEQFAGNIEQSILNFNKLQEYGIDLDEEGMQDVYELLTGFDSAGNNHFSKILNDTDSLVELAVWALNGNTILSNIVNYYNKEISNVRKESYKKGLEAGKKDNLTVVYKNKPINNNKSKYDTYDDLD